MMHPIKIRIHNTGSDRAGWASHQTVTQPWCWVRYVRENANRKVSFSQVRCGAVAVLGHKQRKEYWTNRQDRAIIRRQRCCGSGMFIWDQNLFHQGSRDQGQKDSGSRIRILIKNFKFLTLRIVLKLSEIWSRIRISTFYPFRIPDRGVKKAPDPGSGSATLDDRVSGDDRWPRQPLHVPYADIADSDW